MLTALRGREREKSGEGGENHFRLRNFTFETKLQRTSVIRAHLVDVAIRVHLFDHPCILPESKIKI